MGGVALKALFFVVLSLKRLVRAAHGLVVRQTHELKINICFWWGVAWRGAIEPLKYYFNF
jgi:hypothetical protein